METTKQDISAIIADEIVEIYKEAKPSSPISPQAQKARFEGLVQLVKTVFTALEQAELGKVQDSSRPKGALEEWFAFVAKRDAHFGLVVQVNTEGLHFHCERRDRLSISALGGAPTLGWDPHHKRWVGPRLERDFSKAGAPWIRESAEAAVARAILTAYEVVVPKEP